MERQLLDRASIEVGVRLFHAHSHPTRLRILDYLSLCEQPQRVTEIVKACGGATQVAVSQQLRVLRNHHILQSQRVGTSIFYSVQAKESLELLRWIRTYANQAD